MANGTSEHRRKCREEFFRGKVCEWCGGKDRLELHHRDPNEKITHRIWAWGKARREAEITKCSVLCYACHKMADRTNREMEKLTKSLNGYKYGDNKQMNVTEMLPK